jgi:hypothetical protein
MELKGFLYYAILKKTSNFNMGLHGSDSCRLFDGADGFGAGNSGIRRAAAIGVHHMHC